MTITKRCGICQEEKPLTEFYKNKGRKGGHVYDCKACRRLKSVIRTRDPIQREKDRQSKIRNKAKRLYYAARLRARYKGLPFDITLDDIVIPEVCPVLGIPIVRDAKSERVDGSPTLDRIDPSKGYVKGNICVMSNKANTIKSFGTIEDHQKIIDFMRRVGGMSCVIQDSQPPAENTGSCDEVNTINAQAGDER